MAISFAPKRYVFDQAPSLDELRTILQEVGDLQRGGRYQPEIVVEFREPHSVFINTVRTKKVTETKLRLCNSPVSGDPSYQISKLNYLVLDGHFCDALKRITLLPVLYEDPANAAQVRHRFVRALHKNAWNSIRVDPDILLSVPTERLKLRKLPKLRAGIQTELQFAFDHKRDYRAIQPGLPYAAPQIEVEVVMTADGSMSGFLRTQEVHQTAAGENEDGRRLTKQVFAGSGQEWKLLSPKQMAWSTHFEFLGEPAKREI